MKLKKYIQQIIYIDILNALAFAFVGLFLVIKFISIDSLLIFVSTSVIFFCIGLFLRLFFSNLNQRYILELKAIGTVLLVLAGIFFIGVLSSWKLESWLIVDWLTIIICTISGVLLISKR